MSMNRARFGVSIALFLSIGALATLETLIGIQTRMGAIESLVAAQRRAMIDRLIAMPLERHEKLSRGDLISRLTADVNESSRLITATYLFVDVSLVVVTAVAYLLYLCWEVGLAVIASCGVVMVITALANKKVPAQSEAFQRSLGELTTHTLNSQEGITVVKSFSAQDAVASSLFDRARGAFKAGMELARGMALRRAGNYVAMMLPIGAAFVYGGYMAMIGRISVGGIAATYMSVDSLSQLAIVGRRWQEMQRSAGAFRRVAELLDAEPDVVPALPATERIALPAAPPAVAVQDLTFGYEAGAPILRGVSFQVQPGSKVAIMGKSGCGKSTLLKLMAGLYAPKPGEVLVNGLDMHYHRLSTGRRQLTYIPQEPFLSAGTVRENLTLSSPDPGQGEIEAALESADSSSIIDDLPGRLDAQVGERGSLLSGGQRQRLCIARGLLRHTPVLLLDEPTSALDAESERRIARSLIGVDGLTCVFVTHRFEIAEQCDRVFVMQDGNLNETGRS
jgi:ABC-type multidrug transport system fused ATPase/permease subunit